jgi:hypothetical protein
MNNLLKKIEKIFLKLLKLLKMKPFNKCENKNKL